MNNARKIANKHIYPLNALRAFEASARHLSFVRAAEELSVTPAAVSHQVKKLEYYLGTHLFQRLPHELLLEGKGKVLMSELREVFLRLDKTMERALADDPQSTLTINADPMFAVKLVVPLLYKFNVLNPHINVRISSSFGKIDFRRDHFDAAILFGQGKYPGFKALKLFEESVTPMYNPRSHPRSLEGTTHAPLQSFDDLRHHVLLHDDYLSKLGPKFPSWASWLKSSGAEHLDASQGVHFSQPDHALQAAIDGEGVVLGWHHLATNDIVAGRLIQPFSFILPLGLAFYLVYPEAYADRPEISTFLDWLSVEGP